MSNPLKIKFSKLNSYIDESFNFKLGSAYRLLLQIDSDRILIGVIDGGSTKFMAFENYSLQNSESINNVSDIIDLIVSESKLLVNNYTKINIILSSKQATLVPNGLFDEEKSQTFLAFNHKLNEDEEVRNEKLKFLDITNVFALPLALKSKIESFFSNGKISYHHSSSALIDLLISENKNQNTKKVHASIQNNHFELVITEGKNLLFFNTFSYYSPEDFIYYVLFVYEQLQINPETSELILLGEIERNSSLYAITQKYIRTIKFGERASRIELVYQLHQLPKYFYYSFLTNYYF